MLPFSPRSGPRARRFLVCTATLLPLLTLALTALPAPAAAKTSSTKPTPIHKLTTSAAATPYTEHGIVMHYYPGLFQTVARNRGMRLRHDVDGYASRQRCAELGTVIEARIRNPRTWAWGAWRRFQVVDCSAPWDLAYHRRIGLILEVDYDSAAVAGFVYQGRSEVEVRP